jgi:hypothetical protein
MAAATHFLAGMLLPSLEGLLQPSDLILSHIAHFLF